MHTIDEVQPFRAFGSRHHGRSQRHRLQYLQPRPAPLPNRRHTHGRFRHRDAHIINIAGQAHALVQRQPRHVNPFCGAGDGQGDVRHGRFDQRINLRQEILHGIVVGTVGQSAIIDQTVRPGCAVRAGCGACRRHWEQFPPWAASADVCHGRGAILFRDHRNKIELPIDPGLVLAPFLPAGPAACALWRGTAALWIEFMRPAGHRVVFFQDLRRARRRHQRIIGRHFGGGNHGVELLRTAAGRDTAGSSPGWA